jgi:hypothetical protein
VPTARPWPGIRPTPSRQHCGRRGTTYLACHGSSDGGGGVGSGSILMVPGFILMRNPGSCFVFFSRQNVGSPVEGTAPPPSPPGWAHRTYSGKTLSHPRWHRGKRNTRDTMGVVGSRGGCRPHRFWCRHRCGDDAFGQRW